VRSNIRKGLLLQGIFLPIRYIRAVNIYHSSHLSFTIDISVLKNIIMDGCPDVRSR